MNMKTREGIWWLWINSQNHAYGLMWCEKKKVGLGSRQVNVKHFPKVGLCWTAEKSRWKGPAVPLTFSNETAKLGDCGRRVMSCTRHIGGGRRRRMNRTPFLLDILHMFKEIIQHFRKYNYFVSSNREAKCRCVVLFVCVLHGWIGASISWRMENVETASLALSDI